MSNPNKSYFDKYTLPVVRDIDKVNIYEFENGMDYEMTTSGKTINIDTIKEAQSKVLKNLKKDPNYYTNMLVNETIKMVGEYGSGKKPGARDTAKSAEAVKKDGKMPKADKQDAPYGLKDEVKGKYKSSGMEPLKSAKLNEGYDVYSAFSPAVYLSAMDYNGQTIKSVRDAIKGDIVKKKYVTDKLTQYAEERKNDEKIQAKVEKAIKDIRDDAPISESKGIPSEQLKKLKQLVSKLKEEGKKDLASALERLLSKGVEEGMDYTISNQETADKPGPGFYNRGSLSGFEEGMNELVYTDISVKKSPEWQKMKNEPQDVLSRRPPGEVLKDKEGYRKVVNKTGKTGEFYGNVGPKGSLPEDVNVKDSRKIKLTPTTKNQILTLVHEMAKSMKERVAYKVDDEVASFDSDSAAMDFKNKNSNIQTIKKL